MMSPSSRARMCGRTACTRWKAPLRFVSTSACQSSTVMRSMARPGTLNPALFTRMSMVCVSSVRATSGLWSRSVASASTALTVPGKSAASAAVSWRFCARRPVTTTLAPSAANASAMPRPMPEPPPVTIAPLPARRNGAAPLLNARRSMARSTPGIERACVPKKRPSWPKQSALVGSKSSRWQDHAMPMVVQNADVSHVSLCLPPLPQRDGHCLGLGSSGDERLVAAQAEADAAHRDERAEQFCAYACACSCACSCACARARA